MVKFVWYNLTTFVLKNLRQLFDKYTVTRTEHDALVKSTMKIFSNFVAFSENPNFNYNKRGVEGGKKSKKSINVEGGKKNQNQ